MRLNPRLRQLVEPGRVHLVLMQGRLPLALVQVKRQRIKHLGHQQSIQWRWVARHWWLR